MKKADEALREDEIAFSSENETGVALPSCASNKACIAKQVYLICQSKTLAPGNSVQIASIHTLNRDADRSHISFGEFPTWQPTSF
jgi:hypothetical protein